MSRVDKEKFPHLLFELWKSFLPEYLTTGFRQTGIYPFSREAIPASKLQTSSFLVERPLEGTEEEPTSAEPGLPGETHVQRSIRRYFGEIFQPSDNEKEREGRTAGRDVLPVRPGEILTSEEFIQRVQQEQQTKKRPRAKKGERGSKRRRTKTSSSSGKNNCTECGRRYEDDTQRERVLGWLRQRRM